MKVNNREVMEYSILRRKGVAKFVVLTKSKSGEHHDHAFVDVWEKSKFGIRHAIVGEELSVTNACNTYGWIVGYSMGFGWIPSTHDSLVIRSGVVYMDRGIA